MKTKSRIIGIVLGIICFLQILAVGMNLLLYMDSMYLQVLSHHEIQSSYQLNEQETIENFRAVTSYLKPGRVLNGDQLILPILPISEKGVKHFKEVRNWYRLADGIFLMLFIPQFWYRRGHKISRISYKMTAITMISLTAGFLSVVFLSFHTFFETLHQVIFCNLYWKMDLFEDPVILYFPETYFFYCTLLLLMLEAAIAVSLWLIVWKRNGDGEDG